MGWRTVWRGTDEESTELLAALDRNCTCTYQEEDKTGVRLTICAGHSALVNDQRFLDGLLEVRHNRDRFTAKEWGAL